MVSKIFCTEHGYKCKGIHWCRNCEKRKGKHEVLLYTNKYPYKEKGNYNFVYLCRFCNNSYSTMSEEKYNKLIEKRLEELR